MTNRNAFLLLLMAFMTMSFIQPSFAQDANEEFNVEEDMPTEEELDALDPKNQAKGVKDLIVFRDKEYRRSTYQNMSKLFWSFGFPDIESDKDIDIFFQINECDLYTKYYGNEFEWGPLRETMRDYLRSSSDHFSKQLYFDLPIMVGIYNIEKGNFTVESKNFNSAERNFFPHPTYVGWNKNFCGYTRTLKADKAYPRDGLFKLIRPLNIPHIKVSEEKAKELVKKWKEGQSEKRFLAIRLYMTVTKYMGAQDFGHDKDVAVYLAYIEGYEIYENLTMENLLYSKSYTKKKKGEIPSLTNQRTSQVPQNVSLVNEDEDIEVVEEDEITSSEEAQEADNSENIEEPSELGALKGAPPINKKQETLVEMGSQTKSEPKSKVSSEESLLDVFD